MGVSFNKKMTILGSGGGALEIVRVDADADAQAGQILFVDASAGPVVITAPDAAGAKDERFAVVKDDDSVNLVTVQPMGVVLRLHHFGAEFQSDGSNWIGRPM
jgi:hypothetical protein